MASMVTTERPATARAGSKQLTTGSPSSSTVQAPHTPSPQTSLVPVRSSESRRTSTSSVSLSAATEQETPLTVKSTIIVAIVLVISRIRPWQRRDRSARPHLGLHEQLADPCRQDEASPRAPRCSSNQTLRQKLGEETIHHPTLRVHRSYPVAKLTPSLTVNREKVFLLHERSLVQQRNALPLVRELVVLAEVPLPRRQVAEGVDGVDCQDVPVASVRQNRAGILGNMVGDEGGGAAESILLEMLVSKFAILVKCVKPLAGRKRPEAEAESGGRRSAAVVHDLIRVVQGKAACHMQGSIGDSEAGEIQITA